MKSAGQSAAYRCLWVFALAWCSFANAQTAATGALVGTVTDSSGAVMQNVSVVATESETRVQRTATTDKSGLYRIGLLPPGKYTVEFSANQFKTQTRTGVVVNVTETHTLDAVLSVGERAEKVEVTGNAAFVQTEATTLGGVVGEETVQNLPLTTRNYTQILGLSPGVNSNVTNAGELGRNTADVQVHGMRTLYNNYQMDGAEVNNFASGRGGEFLGYAGIAIPNPDALQEFKVQTSLYDAGHGKAVGANVNVVTKSGGNDFHGSLFEFFRNEALNANDFFLKRNNEPKPVLRQNQFGGTIGGPIVRDKFFFFGSYQGTRQTNGLGSRSLQSSILPPITDDRSAAALGSQFCGQSGVFGGVAVACDGSNINPVALALLNVQLPDGSFYIPTPQTIRPDGFGFSVFSIPSRFSEDQYLGNFDYQLSKTHSLGARWFYSDDPQTLAFTQSNIPGSGARAFFGNRVLSLRATSVLSPTLVNNATAAFTRNIGDLQSLTPVNAVDIGMTPGSDQDLIPTIDIDGMFSLGGNFNDNIVSAVNSYQFSDELSWQRGRHNFRAGFRFERIQDNFDIPGVKRGALLFLSFPDFLLGMDGTQNGSGISNVFFSFGLGGITERAWRVSNYSSFIQDDFKIHPRVTLNLGLRWDILGLVSDDQGRLTNFWPDLADNNIPPGGTLDGFVVPTNFPTDQFPLPAGVGSSGNKTVLESGAPLTNIGPRLGVAWQPFARTNRFVVRGGYGIFYAQTSGDHFAELLVEPPFLSIVEAEGTGNAAATFQVPFNPPLQPIPLWTPRTATSQLAISTFDKNYNTPRAQHYSLNIQYEIVPDYLLELGYVGVWASRVVRGRQINQALLASPTNPVNGITTNTLANAAQRVPILGFGPRGLNQRETRGDAIYNGLETAFTKRFSKGFTFKTSYTYSKTLDEVQGTTGFGAAFTGSFTGDVRNSRQMRGPSEFDRRHRLVFSYVWELPWYKNQEGLASAVLGGWQLAGVLTTQSGTQLTLLDRLSGSIYGFSNQRAHLCPGVGNGSIPTGGSVDNRLDNYFQVSAFCTPPAIGDGFDFGNTSRGIVRGPDQRNVDIAISKIFGVPGWTEDSSLEFRTEFFNAFNTPQFANPGTNVRNADFGIITGTSVAPRIIQFALKYRF